MLNASYQVSSQLISVQEKEAKNRISRWRPRRPSWISDRKDFSIFDIQVTSMLSTSLESIGLLVQKKNQKIDFQDGRHFSMTVLAVTLDFRSEQF